VIVARPAARAWLGQQRGPGSASSAGREHHPERAGALARALARLLARLLARRPLLRLPLPLALLPLPLPGQSLPATPP
jgi:hypothetical protein